MELDSSVLDFASKYPFSSEAREIVQKESNEISMKYLNMAAKQVQGSMTGPFNYTKVKISSIMLDHVMAYLYSRMVLSAIKRADITKAYAIAEAKRSCEALASSDAEDIMNISRQLGINITKAFASTKDDSGIEEFTVGFVDYVKNTPRMQGFDLVNQRLSGGVVILNKNAIAKVLEQAIIKEIMKGLPIDAKELPKSVLDYSKTLKFSIAAKTDSKKVGARKEQWIERLLETPIADVRHRTVNLILAPYLVNSKGLEVEAAAKIINEYIERCKLIDPNTKINERYIEYQCNYAKRKGSKPMSMERARELLGDVIEEVTKQ